MGRNIDRFFDELLEGLYVYIYYLNFKEKVFVFMDLFIRFFINNELDICIE